jgi:hypothetical protein
MHLYRMEPNPGWAVLLFMMAQVLSIAKKIIQPVVLAIVMLFMTPVAGLLNAALRATPPAQFTSNETVVYKTPHSSIAFKS